LLAVPRPIHQRPCGDRNALLQGREQQERARRCQNNCTRITNLVCIHTKPRAEDGKEKAHTGEAGD
jgi:hypothetical protein